MTAFLKDVPPTSVASMCAALAIIVLAVSNTFSNIYGPPPEPWDPVQYCLQKQGNDSKCVAYLGKVD